MLSGFPERARTALRFFRRDGRSTAAMEFAFVAPVIVIILLGVYELCNAAIVYEEVQNAAHSIPASASNLAVLGTGATELTYAQIQLAESEVWAEIPQLRSGLQNGGLSVTITSVTFIPTLPPAAPKSQTPQPKSTCTPSLTTTCPYTPTVVWSVSYAGGLNGASRNITSASVYRSCTGAPTVSNQANATVEYTDPKSGVISYPALPGGLNNEAAQTSTLTKSKTVVFWTPSDLASLPTYSVAQNDPNWAPPSPILVVDVHLKYLPIFGLFLRSGIDFYGTGLFPVRSVQASEVNQTTGAVTALTLSEQFTTLQDDATDAANGVIPNATSGTYCINTSAYLNPSATSTS
jgi:Flp pilus assembly protein TadG